MKFRIISDLHIDINHDYEEYMKFDPDAFYLIPGDISGSYTRTSEFIENHIPQGCFIMGNHEGYDFTFNDHSTDRAKENIAVRLAQDFPLDGKVSFLENDYKEIGEDIIVVGCVLYTDFKLYTTVPQEEAMAIAHKYMNDFRYVLTYGTDGELRQVTPSDYLNRFNTSLNFIEDVCNKFPNKKIVVMTHHAPSIKSITGRYVQDVLSAAYASNLDEFIKKHENIKLFVHGHVHNKAKYKFRNRAQVIVNPMGYYNETNQNLNRYLGVPFTL